MKMIEMNQTWELIEKIKGNDVIGLKWSYKTIFSVDGSIQKQKARFVEKRYSQQYGIDFNKSLHQLWGYKQ